MAISITTPITGAAQTGFTTPSFTVATDQTNSFAKGVVVTAVSGTGTAGTTVHSVSSPFSFSFTRPTTYKSLGPVNPVTGQLRSVPRNVCRARTLHGVTVLSGQPTEVMDIDTLFRVPAGADTVDAVNIRSAVSLGIGALNQQSAGIGDSLVQGSI